MASTVFPAPMPLDQPAAPGANPEIESLSPGDGKFTQDALPYEFPSRVAKGDIGWGSLPTPRALTTPGLPFANLKSGKE